jgi:hypothetical protein
MFISTNFQKYYHFIILILIFLLISLSVFVYFFLITPLNQAYNLDDTFLDKKFNLPLSAINNNKNVNLNNSTCNFFTCFNVYSCGHKGNQLLVYVYPQKHQINTDKSKIHDLTKHFHSILYAIIGSKYYTSNPEEACIFIPSIEIFYQNREDIYVSHNLNVQKL